MKHEDRLKIPANFAKMLNALNESEGSEDEIGDEIEVLISELDDAYTRGYLTRLLSELSIRVTGSLMLEFYVSTVTHLYVVNCKGGE